MNNSTPSTWLNTTVGKVVHLERGITFPSSTIQNAPNVNLIVCLRTTNIQKEINWEDLIYIPRSFVTNKAKLLRENDILISTANSKALVGKVALVNNLPFEATVGGFNAIIRTNVNLLDSRYLYYFLNAEFSQRRLSSISAQTTNIANLTTDSIATFPIPLPPLSEQRRIVEILHEAAEVRRLRSEARAQLQIFLESVFRQMFIDGDYRSVPIESVLIPDGIRTGPFGTQLKTEELVSEGNPIFGIENVLTDRFNPVTTKFIDDTKYEQLKRYKIESNDVLLTRMGTIGRSCVVPDTIPEKSVISFHLFRLRVKSSECLPAYLSASFNYDPFIKHQLNSQASGAVMAGLNSDTVRSIQITLPSVELQEKFLRIVTENLANLPHFDLADALSQSLTTSLLLRAFTGSLTEKWRAGRVELLAQEAAERDAHLGAGSGLGSSGSGSGAGEAEQGVETVREHRPVLMAALSTGQQEILMAARTMPGYFTVASLSTSIQRSVPVVQQALTLLAQVGLIQAVHLLLPNPLGDGVVPTLAYRMEMEHADSLSGSE